MERDEEITPGPDFVKGFNEGYILQQREPELAEKISAALSHTERGQGFQGGRAEYQHEQELAKSAGKEQQKDADKSDLPAWLAEDYYDTLNKESDQYIDHDIDRDGPDRD